MTKVPLLLIMAGMASPALLGGCLKPADMPHDAGDAAGSDMASPDMLEDNGNEVLPQTSVKPLTPREYDKAVTLMLGLPDNFGSVSLPVNIEKPFDNNVNFNNITSTHVVTYGQLALRAADVFLASSHNNLYLTCTPTGASDRGCLETFALRLYTLAYRHPVTAADVQPVVDLALQNSVQVKDFNEGIRVLIFAALQDPQFLNRIEVGKTQPDGSQQLEDFEYLSKLSFFVRAGPPSLADINAVAGGAFATPDSKRAFVESFVTNQKSVSGFDEFQSFWFFYPKLGNQTDFSTALRYETRQHIDRLISQNMPWRTLLNASDTFADDGLAVQYNLADQPAAAATPPAPAVAPAADTWVKCADEGALCSFDGLRIVRYGAPGKYVTRLTTVDVACTSNAFGGDPATGTLKTCEYNTSDFKGWRWRKYQTALQQGLLSQASVLSVGGTDTGFSMTKRGYDMQKSLFCAEIGAPPPVDDNGNPINLDAPPLSTVAYDCQEDLYRQTVLKSPSCASCHGLMNTLSFGLNNFDQFGRFRNTETGKPQCGISGNGELFLQSPAGNTKVADFNGPKQLADIALNSGKAEECLATKLLEFNSGRKLTAADRSAVLRVKARNDQAAGFRDFLVAFLLSPAFTNRMEN